MNLEDLYDFAFNLNILLKRSDDVTKQTIDSISSLDLKITESHLRLQKIFGNIDYQHKFIQNINDTVEELDVFLKLYDSIEIDKLRITDGPLGAFNEYIEKLVYIKTIEKFHWLKDIAENSNSNSLKLLLVKYHKLLSFGEKVLFQEFKDVIKHYSNQECLNSFIEHLIRFNTDEKIEQNLFIPMETLYKLEQICWWFIKQEQLYELYDEHGEHCDITQKLKYILTRNQYLKLAIETHRSILLDKATEKNNRENETLSLFERLSKNVTKSTKATERIELFTCNLDFCLRVLKHENMLIANIYYRSKETRVDLISKLTILVIDSIQNELEEFFVSDHDFSKLSHNGVNVVKAFINLIIKVQNLKEKASCLQTEDLPSASKLLQFSLRLNEMSAQIFNSYLDVVKTGYFNTYIVPTNCSVHEYCIQTLDMCRLMKKEHKGLMDSIKIVCELDKNLPSKSNSDKPIESGEYEYKSVRNNRGKKKYQLSEDNDEYFSSRMHLAKYFSLLIEKLIYFLVEETLKFSSKHLIILPDSVTYTLRFSKLNEFKDALKSLKIFTFLINNIEHIILFINEMNMMDLFKKINPEFETNLNKNISFNEDKACEVFRFLARKWINIGESETTKSLSRNITIYKKPIEIDNSIRMSAVLLASIVPLNPAVKKEISEPKSLKKSSINPFVQSKAKKRGDFLMMLRETVVVCTRIVVFDEKSNRNLKSMASEILRPVLSELNETDDLNGIFKDLEIDSRDLNLIFEKIFPIKTFKI